MMNIENGELNNLHIKLVRFRRDKEKRIHYLKNMKNGKKMNLNGKQHLLLLYCSLEIKNNSFVQEVINSQDHYSNVHSQQIDH